MMPVASERDAEAGRIAALHRYDILDTPAEPKFDRIVRMASQLLGTPIAVMSLIDESRQWFKARVGLDGDETPRSIAFCSHAIEAEHVMVVEDATSDPRFSANPLVTGDPNIRFYAGAPLATPDGYKLGTLCVIDRVPRQITAEQRALLADLASLVVDEMELRRVNTRLTHMATTDPMTGLCNRRGFHNEAEAERERALRYGRPLSLLMLDIDHFKAINDRYGHDVGDETLIRVAQICQTQKRLSDIGARLGGEEFAILMPETDRDGARRFAERLRDAVAAETIWSGDVGVSVTISIGIAELSPEGTIEGLLKAADNALYEAKRGGRNRVCTARPASMAGAA